MTDMDTDGPLDFELEDPLLNPSLLTRKRRKVIGLDDLLTDFYKEQSKAIEKESKRVASSRECYNSDDEEDTNRNSKEALLSQFVDECQKQVQGIKADDEIPLWGIQVFGNQKRPPLLVFPELKNCKLLQSFMSNELNSVVELTAEKGQTFLEGLLVNGWLPRLAVASAHVEESVASWTFNLMLYSLTEQLRASACDFWCSILLSKEKVEQRQIKIDWFPSFAEVKGALEVYGFLLDSSTDFSSLPAKDHTDSDSEGPPQNIRFWIKFVIACCQSRRIIFSNLETEELLSAIICLFLDRQLQGLSLLLYDCMLSIISFFKDDEWSMNCEKVAKCLAQRTKKDLNCLRLVECISGVDARSKQLRSELAFQVLINCLDRKVSDGEEILRLLISINMKEKDCDFFSMYIYLVLTENWLFSNPLLEENAFILEMWGVYLRNCSCQINSTDMRSYASKVRNKASYLLQSITDRKD